jgi:hypothetical protein
MRYMLALGFPFLVQVMAFLIVFAASRGGGSFMGLLAIPVAAVAIPSLIVIGWTGARGTRPLGGLVMRTLAIALVPPVFLLIFRALES